MKIRITLVMVMFLSLLTISTFSKTANADLYVGGPNTGQRAAWYSNSVTSYGYNSLFNQGRASWDNISSKVKVLYTPSTSTTSDRYYVGTTPTANVLGIMLPFRNVSGTVRQVFTTEPWQFASVSAYHNEIQSWGLSDPQIVSMVTAHEIGHSLGLDHSPHQIYSMMIGPSEQLYAYPPTDYDKSELRRKWGN